MYKITKRSNFAQPFETSTGKMIYNNNTMVIRRQLLASLAKLHKNGDIEDKIDYLPIEISPRERGANRRCCVYKERAVAKYKLLPLMGFHTDIETNELTTLKEYYALSKQRKIKENRILTVVDEACTACVKVKYVITNLCQGCVGRHCMVNCPKDCIDILDNNQAKINKKECVNCGICKEACPYHAIVYLPVPCEEACPVNAITKDENGIEHIDDDKCIYCGRCVNACPFGSILEISEALDVLDAIKSKQKVIAMVAPSIMGQYQESIGKVLNAIKEIGFFDVVEVAKGAMDTARNEAIELKENLEKGVPLMTTSCCPSYVETVNKHVIDLKPYLSHTKSPMYYIAEQCRKEHPDAKLVFIGPCVAKRKEMQNSPNVDFVMTFDEISSIMEGYGIEIDQSPDLTLSNAITLESRNFALSGGVAESVLAEKLSENVKPFKINGLDKKAIGLLRSFTKGKSPSQFVEVMACQGGCICGPSGNRDQKKALQHFTKNMEETEHLDR